MIQKLPVPPRSAAKFANHEPLPESSQAPEALGEGRFQKRQLHLWGSDVLAWNSRFHEAPLLQKLALQSSSTSHVPEDIKTLRHLTTLTILNVSLYEFPLWICEMTQLKKLTVRGTNITHIPDEISKLTKLRYLELGNNLLSRLDADLRGCRKLRWLNLGDNDLEALPSRLPPKLRPCLAATPFRLYNGFQFKDFPSE